MRRQITWIFAAILAAWAPTAFGEAASTNLVQNPSFTQAGDDARLPAHFTVKGDAEWVSVGGKFEFAPPGIAFYPWLDLDHDGKHAGAVTQDVTRFEPGRGKWFRFSFRGMAENNFAVNNDGLLMKVDFYAKKGADPLDGVSRKLYPLVEKDRAELAENGPFRKSGAAVWKTYVLDFMLPFNEIDLLRLCVEFRDGAAKTDKQSAFFVTEFSLTPLPDPTGRPKVAKGPKGETVAPSDLIPLGGRWYYRPEKKGEKPARLKIDAANADRLYYLDDRLTNPFADNMTAWLRKGYLDLDGRLVDEDRFVPDNVVIEFPDDKTMVVHARNLPNHPTAVFPAPPGSGDRNPSYIQEHNYTYTIPLYPVHNPKAVAMTKNNSNRGLPMGATGIAINGVVFYNPFDAGMQDATDFMDRCCGHPSPDNRYHYHKYPVCVKSPFVDEGDEHSPLIGWAFDGYPIYGPYESKGLMAKDAKDNPLNEFNLHYDEARGWHYHVTPGKFPYVIGGYWGEVDGRNMRRGPGPRPGGP
jgi:hypothetical protein